MTTDATTDAFIRGLPKAELHLHIEGTLEPELMFDLAARNGVDLPFASVDEIRAAYRFSDLQSFLDIYYQGAAVLRTEQDFHDLMAAYLRRAHDDGVRRAEIFFDPQTHTERSIPFDVFMNGFTRAITDAERETGISADAHHVLPAPPAGRGRGGHLAGGAALPEQIRVSGSTRPSGNPAGALRRALCHGPGGRYAAGGPRRRGGSAGVHHSGARHPGGRADRSWCPCEQDQALVDRLVAEACR